MGKETSLEAQCSSSLPGGCHYKAGSGVRLGLRGMSTVVMSLFRVKDPEGKVSGASNGESSHFLSTLV